MQTEICCSQKNKKHLEFCFLRCKIVVVEIDDESDSLRDVIACYQPINICADEIIALTAHCLVQTNYTNNPVHGRKRTLFIHDFYD